MLVYRHWDFHLLEYQPLLFSIGMSMRNRATVKVAVWPTHLESDTGSDVIDAPEETFTVTLSVLLHPHFLLP